MIPSFIFGKIIETEQLEEAMGHLSVDTLVLFDLDNTLIESSHQFGSIQWEENYRTELMDLGKSHDDAHQIAHDLWFEVLPSIRMRLVDKEAPLYIQKMRQKGCVVLGLTARPPESACHTLPELDRLGIQFDDRYSDLEFSLNYTILFQKGVLYCGIYDKKSSALLALLKKLELSPKKIIFIDDKLSHVQDLKEALASVGIEYVGIRYSKADLRVKQFDAKIAKLQKEAFPKILSDDEAKAHLLSQEK